MAETDAPASASAPAPAVEKVDAAASTSASTSEVKPPAAANAPKDGDFDVLAGLDDDQIDLKIARQSASGPQP